MKAESHHVLRYEARGHAQAGSGGPEGETATGDWPAPKRRELCGDRRPDRAQPDRGVRHLPALRCQWRVLDGAIKAPVLIGFLHRLIRDAQRKVFLILDRLRVHRSAAVREWLAQHKAQIEVSYLPSDSPDLNPDEGLNADLKDR